MKVVVVTHAKTMGRPPRRLSLAGRYEVEMAVDLIKGHMPKGYVMHKAVSSSAARCLDTAISCLEELGAEDIRRIETDARLARLDRPEKLEGVIRDNAQEGLAIFCHADLGGVLPHPERIKKVQDGWFTVRPVVAILDWPTMGKWADVTVEYLSAVPEEPLLEG